jgi:phosphoribosylaminoimidazole-succinocarboxamide synthase
VSFSGTDDDVVVRNYRTGARLERLTKGLGSKVRMEISKGMKRPVKHV